MKAKHYIIFCGELHWFNSYEKASSLNSSWIKYVCQNGTTHGASEELIGESPFDAVKRFFEDQEKNISRNLREAEEALGRAKVFAGNIRRFDLSQIKDN